MHGSHIAYCEHPGCFERVRGARRCERHKNLRQREWSADRPATDKYYSTARWQKLRRYKLALNPLCEICQTSGETEPAVLVDHIQPVRDGGSMWLVDNLQSLCRSCHNIKTKDDLTKRKEYI